MSKTGTYEYITEMQGHMKALGQDQVYMDKGEPVRWDLVTSLETGGSFRLGVSTSQRIHAMHPSGIEMIWFIDLEPSSANGTGVLQLDTKIISEILDNAPSHATSELRKWMSDAAKTLEDQIVKQSAVVDRLKATHDLFVSASGPGTSASLTTQPNGDER